jgi:hypothetical protein
MQLECSCGKLVDVADDLAGRETLCPRCGCRLESLDAVDMMGNPLDEAEEVLPVAHDAEDEPLPLAMDAPAPSRNSRSAQSGVNGAAVPVKPGVLPLMLLAAAVVVLILVVAIVALNSGGPSGVAKDPKENYRQRLDATTVNRPTETPQATETGGGGGGFFGNIPDGRTSEDYRRERERRLNGGQ